MGMIDRELFRLPRCFGVTLYILLILLIPSTGGAGEWDPLINKLAADGNGDGAVDLFVMEDALFSMGNYLRSNGWRGSMRSRRKQRRAIYNYNHSRIYVNTVLAVADYLEEGRTVYKTGK